jgi:hypothetical protein
MKFAESLVSGKESERLVLNIIKNKYPQAYIKEGYHKEYDIMIPETNKTVEVKKDFKSQYTGNIVVEISMNNKRSALSTTTADWWVFHTNDKELIWITPKNIKEMIYMEKFEPVEFTGKGDTVSKVAYLIPKAYFSIYGTNSKLNQGVNNDST